MESEISKAELEAMAKPRYLCTKCGWHGDDKYDHALCGCNYDAHQIAPSPELITLLAAYRALLAVKPVTNYGGVNVGEIRVEHEREHPAYLKFPGGACVDKHNQIGQLLQVLDDVYPELLALRSVAEAVKPFAELVSTTSGRIPVERLSLANWHALAKAFNGFNSSLCVDCNGTGNIATVSGWVSHLCGTCNGDGFVRAPAALATHPASPALVSCSRCGGLHPIEKMKPPTAVMENMPICPPCCEANVVSFSNDQVSELLCEIDRLAKAATPPAAAEGEVRRLREVVSGLLSVATFELKHSFCGNCPEEFDRVRRDPECPACKMILAASAPSQDGGQADAK